MARAGRRHTKLGEEAPSLPAVLPEGLLATAAQAGLEQGASATPPPVETAPRTPPLLGSCGGGGAAQGGEEGWRVFVNMRLHPCNSPEDKRDLGKRNHKGL